MPEPTTDAPQRFPFLDAIQQPIPGDNPVGEDVTYDEDFQRIKDEIDTLATASAGDVDFDEVVDRARIILSTKSKDLRVASFMTLALVRNHGLTGLAEGLSAVQILVDQFWEPMYPPTRRMIARRNALQMLSDRLKDWVGEVKPTKEERDDVEQALAACKALQDFCLAAMEDQAPMLSGLTRAIEDALRRVPKEAAPPPEPAAAARPEPGSGAARPTSSSPSTAASADSGEPRSPQEARRHVLSLASFLREKDPASPESYQVTRAVQWGSLVEEPPHEAGLTLIEAPASARRTYLTGLLPKGDYATLVREAEASFQEPPFHLWLDAQRLIAAAMEALGEPYRAAREAIVLATAGLLQRVPNIAALKYKDGTPFADPMTVDRINEHVKSALGSGEGGGAATATSGNEHLEAQYDEARTLMGRGDLAGALTIMKDASEDTNRQDTFRRRLYTAELCLKGGQPGIARSMLEALDETVGHHALEEWDAALTLRVWSTLYRSYQALAAQQKGEDGALQQRAHAVFEKISRLDPAYALAYVSGP